MIKQILNQIWNERKSNAWLWAELLIVSVVLWVIVDWGYVMLRTYLQPLGFNIENTYMLRFAELTPKSNLYIPPGTKTTTIGEDFLAIIERLNHHPDIEWVSLSLNASPYNGSNSSNRFKYDTITVSRQTRYCTPEFFNVFRYENTDGSGSHSLANALKSNTVVVGSNILEGYVAENEQLKGKVIYLKNDTTTQYTIAALTNPIRYDDFTPPFTMKYYASLIEEKEIVEITGSDLSHGEVCVRVRPGTLPDFQDKLMKDSPKLYRVGNCYIQSVASFDNIRRSFQTDDVNEIKTRGYITFFLLINIFLGIVGTFWFRTQQRRSEMGLRIALGSTTSELKRLLLVEAMVIFLMAFLPAAIISYNIGYADLSGVWQMKWGLARFVPGILITLILMSVMIIAGILYPAHQVTKIEPAEALHEE